MPFENFRGLSAGIFFNSPGLNADIGFSQADLLLFAIGEVALTPHKNHLPSRCHATLFGLYKTVHTRQMSPFTLPITGFL